MNMRTRVYTLVFLFLSQASQAYDGQLDQTFGGNGTISSNFDGFYDFANGLALQRDGKILAAGQIGDKKLPVFALARYLFNGTLDGSFNPQGKIPGLVVTNFGNKFRKAQAQAALVQEDAKILVAGYVTDINSLSSFALARYNQNGTLDASFNAEGAIPGTIVTDSLKVGQAYRVALQSDGKIAVMGNSMNAFAVALYTKDGILDKSFNGTGTATIDFSPLSAFGTGGSIQQDDKIIIAGYLTQLFGSPSYAVARYTQDGHLDTSFNQNGKRPGVLVDTFNKNAQASIVMDMVMQKDGKIIVVGWADNCFALARYNSDGTLDTSFNPDSECFSPDCCAVGKAGVVLTSFSSFLSAKAHAITLDENGNMIVGGLADGRAKNFALARYYQNGSLDTSFHPNGKQPGTVVTSFGGSSNAITSIVTDNKGHLLAAGATNAPGNYAFALARYLLDTSDEE